MNSVRTRAIGIALLTIAVIAAIVVGVLWWGWHGDRSRASERDAAVDGARQVIIDTQTFDTTDVEGTLNRIGSAMTGDLLKDWTEAQRALTADQLNARKESKFRTEPVIVSAAPTEFDAQAHTAKVLVYLVQKFFNDGKLASDAYRWTYIVTVTEVDGAWKASGLVPLQEGGRAGVGSNDPSAPATAIAPPASTVPTPDASQSEAPAPAPTAQPTEGATP